MVQEKKEYKKPEVIKEERYQTANVEHCHQVKDECSPLQLKA